VQIRLRIKCGPNRRIVKTNTNCVSFALSMPGDRQITDVICIHHMLVKGTAKSCTDEVYFTQLGNSFM
jgi:hypothetical protein